MVFENDLNLGTERFSYIFLWLFLENVIFYNPILRWHPDKNANLLGEKNTEIFSVYKKNIMKTSR